jgi:hypothetical protein
MASLCRLSRRAPTITGSPLLKLAKLDAANPRYRQLLADGRAVFAAGAVLGFDRRDTSCGLRECSAQELVVHAAVSN